MMVILGVVISVVVLIVFVAMFVAEQNSDSEAHQSAPVIKGPKYNEVPATAKKNTPRSIAPAKTAENGSGEERTNTALQASADEAMPVPRRPNFLPLIPVAELVIAFEDNEVDAEQRFKEPTAIRGTVGGIETGFFGGAHLMLPTIGPGMYGFVTHETECDFAEQAKYELSGFHRGDRIIVVGSEIRKILTVVTVQNCRVVTKCFDEEQCGYKAVWDDGRVLMIAKQAQ